MKENKTNNIATKTNASELWEKRSQLFGNSKKGVLFQNLPDIINEYLDRWHKHFIFSSIIPHSSMRILDVGCGYGRISTALLKKFPTTKTVGVDISRNYTRLYMKNTGQKAFVGTLEKLPKNLGLYNHIICVTVLFYAKRENHERILRELLDKLKKNGSLILIENSRIGTQFLNGFGLFDLIKQLINPKHINTGGLLFNEGEIETVVNRIGGKIVDQRRFPITSFFMLFLVLFCLVIRNRKIQSWVISFFSLGDQIFSKFRLPSLHVGYVITKR